MENINDVILSFDNTGKITYISPAIHSLGNWNPEDLQGQNLREFIHPDDQESICSYIDNANHETFTAEIRFLGADENYLDVRISCHRRNNNSETTGILSDLTDIKRTQREHEKLQNQLIQSQKMDSIGRLAGGVVHDFDNILGVIMGNAELMIQQIPDGNILKDDAKEILRITQRATELTKQLLAFSRRQVIKNEVLDLNTIIIELISMLRRLLGENIALETHLEENLGHVKLDSSQLEQVLMNLVINAREAMQLGGQLNIFTFSFDVDAMFTSQHPAMRPGRYVVLKVTDSGTGMTKEIKERIFEPFFTTKGVGRGTGHGRATG